MIAAFCGSFDPVTIGHLDLIERAAAMYDKVYVFVTPNSEKKEAFSAEKKVKWIEKAAASCANVEVRIQQGLAVDACRSVHAGVLLRGIRNETDMAYEANMAFINHSIDPEIETVLLFCRPGYTYISSSNVRELLKYHQSIKDFVPACVFEELQPDLALERNSCENAD